MMTPVIDRVRAYRARKKAAREASKSINYHFIKSLSVPVYDIPQDSHIAEYMKIGSDQFRSTTKMYRLLDYILRTESNVLSYRYIRDHLLVPKKVLDLTLHQLHVDGYIAIDYTAKHYILVPNTTLYVQRVVYDRTLMDTVLRTIPYNFNEQEEMSLRKLYTGTTKEVSSCPDIKTVEVTWMTKSERYAFDKRPKWYVDKTLMDVLDEYGNHINPVCKLYTHGNRYTSAVTNVSSETRSEYTYLGERLHEVDAPTCGNTVLVRQIALGAVNLPHIGNYKEVQDACLEAVPEAKGLHAYQMGNGDWRNKYRMQAALGLDDVDKAKDDMKYCLYQRQPGTKYVKSYIHDGVKKREMKTASAYEHKYGRYLASNYPKVARAIRSLKKWMWAYGGDSTLAQYIEYLEALMIQSVIKDAGSAPCIRVHDAIYTTSKHVPRLKKLMMDYLMEPLRAA